MRAASLVFMLAALPAWASAQPAPATDWRVAVTDGRSVAFVDLNSVRRQGAAVTFIMEVRFRSAVAPDGTDAVRSSVGAECDTMRWSLITATSYSGTRTLTTERGPRPMTAVLPDSNAGQLLSAVCANQYRPGTIADPVAHARQLLGGGQGSQ